MSAHAYTESQLVEHPAIGLFAELGWATATAVEELFGVPASGLTSAPWTGAVSLGRETKGEVVLLARLKAALFRLNPSLPPEAIAAAVDELTRDRSAMLLEQANREVYRLLKEGIPVSVVESEITLHREVEGRARHSVRAVPGSSQSGAQGLTRPTSGGQKTVRMRVIDWEQPANNDFLLVRQFSVTGGLYTCRPDLVGFVNGLPLVVIELKTPGLVVVDECHHAITPSHTGLLRWLDAEAPRPGEPERAGRRGGDGRGRRAATFWLASPLEWFFSMD